MNTSPLVILASLTALASAAVGGINYAFSTSVMRGLDRTGPVDAVTAMRGINAEANTSPAFLLGYFSATILALAVGVTTVLRPSQAGNWWVLAGVIFVILGAVITMVFNVPLNNRLDAVNPDGLSVDEAAREWLAYFPAWTAWNHARTVTGLVGAGLIMIGLHSR